MYRLKKQNNLKIKSSYCIMQWLGFCYIIRMQIKLYPRVLVCGHDFNLEFLFMLCDVIIVAVYEIKKEYHIYKRLILFFKIVVEATGIEPATSWSQTTRATNCATPRNQTAYIYYHGLKINSRVKRKKNKIFLKKLKCV